MTTPLMKAHVVSTAEVRGHTQQLPESPWSSMYGDGTVIEPPFDVDGLAQLYETNGPNRACVDAKVSNIVGLGYRFVRTECEDTEDDPGRLAEVFEGRDSETTFTEVLRAVWTDVESVGNGYIEITRDSGRQIDGFYHVPATTVRVSADHERFVQIRSGKTQWFRAYGRGGAEGPGQMNEILHFKKYTPLSSYYGVPDIIAALPAAAGDRAAKAYNLNFFEHNAVPRMAIVVEGGQLSDELLRQIQRFMESEIRGKGHKTLVLDVPGNDVKVRIEPLTVGSGDDASFLGFRKANRDEILMVHRVPPTKVTVVEHANLANSLDQDKTFREQVVRPEQRRIEYRFNKMVREDIGVKGWEFRFREMDLGEEREQAEIARLYSQMGVWGTDEIRARQGLAPKVSDGDG